MGGGDQPGASVLGVEGDLYSKVAEEGRKSRNCERGRDYHRSKRAC